MKKLITLIILLSISFIFTSCQKLPEYKDEIDENVDNSKILIAYFTWADNALDFNEEDFERDVYATASLFKPGNGEIVAQFINGEIGGTMHQILVEEPYSPVYDECLARARTELSQNTRPELKSKVDNFASYEYIFIGFPNWWNQLPRAVLTFIDSYDFANKTVIPFCMHGTNGKNNPVNELANYLPSTTTVMNSLGVYRPNTLSSKNDVIAWLNEMGFNDNEN